MRIGVEKQKEIMTKADEGKKESFNEEETQSEKSRKMRRTEKTRNKTKSSRRMLTGRISSQCL
jgi:hypothetical protein